jgi:hypothetical protein
MSLPNCFLQKREASREQLFCSWGVPRCPCAKLTDVSAASIKATKANFRIFHPFELPWSALPSLADPSF